MDNKYPKHIVDYAIDNKVSLEEAYKHYILNGEQEVEKIRNSAPDINIEEEEKFLSELEQKIKDQLSEDVSNDEEWWSKWHQKMEKVGELEEELNIEKRDDEEITKAEMNWVEAELEQVDKLYNEMYRKDV